MDLLEVARKDLFDVGFANITSLKIYNGTTHFVISFIMHIINKYK
jgi:hypothetical protein